MTREEAIRRIKAWNLDSDDREVLAVVIPELKESEDEKAIKLIRSLLENARNVQSNTSLYKQYDDALAWLEKQKEQKPAEWSEEDKRAIDRACVALRAYANGDLPEFLPSELIGYADRLQSLRPQPKQEWGEEDEDVLQNIIQEIEWERRNTTVDKDIRNYDRQLNFLKSLRPSWKPSEVQMKALEDAFRKDGSDEYRRTINSLYQDLKKLM